MAAKTKPKLLKNELYVSIVGHYGVGAQFIGAGDQLRGDDPSVALRPQLFAPASGGQAAINEASAAYQRDIGLAAQARELAWYGPKQEDPPPPSRVICVKSFTHRGNVVEVGSVWLASHPAVASAASAFVAVED